LTLGLLILLGLLRILEQRLFIGSDLRQRSVYNFVRYQKAERTNLYQQRIWISRDLLWLHKRPKAHPLNHIRRRLKHHFDSHLKVCCQIR